MVFYPGVNRQQERKAPLPPAKKASQSYLEASFLFADPESQRKLELFRAKAKKFCEKRPDRKFLVLQKANQEGMALVLMAVAETPDPSEKAVDPQEVLDSALATLSRDTLSFSSQATKASQSELTARLRTEEANKRVL